MTEIDNEVGEEYDWRSAFDVVTPQACMGFDGSINFDISMVTRIHRAYAGLNDSEDWECIGELSDGRWFFLCAGCDYTGWDCRAWGLIHIGADEEQVKVMGCDDGARSRLYADGVGTFPVEWVNPKVKEILIKELPSDEIPWPAPGNGEREQLNERRRKLKEREEELKRELADVQLQIQAIEDLERIL